MPDSLKLPFPRESYVLRAPWVLWDSPNGKTQSLSFLGNSRPSPAEGAPEELAEIRLETSYWIKQQPGDLSESAAAALWLSTPEHSAQVLTMPDDTGNRPRNIILIKSIRW